jgi:hypothetical protein
MGFVYSKVRRHCERSEAIQRRRMSPAPVKPAMQGDLKGD